MKNIGLNGVLKNGPQKCRSVAMIIGLCITFLMCSQVIAEEFTETNDEVDYFTNNGFSGAVKTMQHPAGEYYKGVTYVAYQGPLEDPYVASYEHATAKWRTIQGRAKHHGQDPGCQDR